MDWLRLDGEPALADGPGRKGAFKPSPQSAKANDSFFSLSQRMQHVG